MNKSPKIGEAGFFNSLADAGFYDADAPARVGEKRDLQCPNCSHERRNKSAKCLSMKRETDGFVIFCHHCGWGKGVKISDGTDDGEQWRKEQQQQQYRQPQQRTAMPAAQSKQYKTPQRKNYTGQYSSNFIAFFAHRGISLHTLQLSGIIEERAYFPALQREEIAAVFPITYGGKLLSYKFRCITEKAFAIVKDTELVLYGSQVLCDLKGTGKKVKCALVEGEIDRLTLLQLGIATIDGSNGIIALSVPNGTNSLACLQKHFDNKDFDCVEQFLMLTDNDAKGVEMRDEFARRVGIERCAFFTYPEGIKDVNELHMRERAQQGWGAAAFWHLVRVNVPPIKGVDTVTDAWQGIMKIREQGHPQYKKVGIDDLDQLFTWHLGGQLTALSAAPNSGKTDFLISTALRLAHLHGAKVGIMSPETGSSAEIYDMLAKCYLGMLTSPAEAADQPVTARELGVATNQQFEDALFFISQHFFVFSCDDVAMRTGDLLAIAEQLVARHGINMLIIDPYNFLEDAFTDPENARAMMSDYLNGNLQRIKHWSYKYDVHTVLVPHPKALQPFVPMEDYGQINGGAAWGNKCDNVLFLNRLFPGKGSEERMERARKKQLDDTDPLLGDNVEVCVRKVKKRYAGKVGTATLAYRIPTGQFGACAEELGVRRRAEFLDMQSPKSLSQLNNNSNSNYEGYSEHQFPSDW